jgi:C_GCAxxG_C_C family probable redox protein
LIDQRILTNIPSSEWQKYAEEAYRLGDHYERKYHGCGQCLLAAVFDALGSHQENVFQSATGLAGGLGLIGKSTCAALIGSVMVFGMVFPRQRSKFDNDRENKYLSYQLAQKMYQRYMDQYGSVICHDIHREILGRSYDLRDPDARAAFEAAGAHDNKCTEVVALTAKWTVKILGEVLQDVEQK